MNRGFTIVETLVVLVIIAVLLALGTFGVRGLQVSGRDVERKSDVETIARALERYYVQGSTNMSYETKGSYPSVNEWLYIFGYNWCSDSTYGSPGNAFSPCYVEGGFMEKSLPGLSTANITPPDKTQPGTFVFTSRNLNSSDITNNLNNGLYFYKPMNSSTSDACYDNGACSRYNLVYKREADGQLITIESKHQ